MTTVRSGNAKLHHMRKVEAEHIAYAFIQVRYLILVRQLIESTGRRDLLSPRVTSGPRQMANTVTVMRTTAPSKLSMRHPTLIGQSLSLSGGTSE